MLFALALLLAAPSSAAMPMQAAPCTGAPTALPAGMEGWAKAQPAKAAGRSEAAPVLTLGTGFAATLLPMSKIAFVSRPEKPGGAAGNGGIFAFVVPTAGRYRVAWGHRPGSTSCAGPRRPHRLRMAMGLPARPSARWSISICSPAGISCRLPVATWCRCRCDCGKEVVAAGGNVRSGSTASCGCLHREICAARLTRHGHRAARRHEPTYRAWQEVRLRAINGLCRALQEDFTAFLSDMGERPARTKLGRHDPGIAFQPGNCVWEPVDDRATRAARGWIRRRSVMETGTSVRA